MSELRRYEATLVHKCGENPYMFMASAGDGDYCEYQQATDEINRLRQLLSEAEKREKEVRRIAANAEAYGYGHGLEAAAKVAEEMPLLRPVSTAHVKTNTPKDVAAAIRALQSEEC